MDYESVKHCESFLQYLYSQPNRRVASEGVYEITQIYLLAATSYEMSSKKKKAKTNKTKGRQPAADADKSMYSDAKGVKVESSTANEQDKDVSVETLAKPLADLLSASTNILDLPWRAVDLSYVSSGSDFFTRGYSLSNRSRGVEETEVKVC